MATDPAPPVNDNETGTRSRKVCPLCQSSKPDLAATCAVCAPTAAGYLRRKARRLRYLGGMTASAALLEETAAELEGGAK